MHTVGPFLIVLVSKCPGNGCGGPAGGFGGPGAGRFGTGQSSGLTLLLPVLKHPQDHQTTARTTTTITKTSRNEDNGKRAYSMQKFP